MNSGRGMMSLGPYAHNLDEESHKAACLKVLDKAVDTLPDFVKVVWKKN